MGFGEVTGVCFRWKATDARVFVDFVGGQLSRKLSSVPWALFICMVSVMSN